MSAALEKNVPGANFSFSQPIELRVAELISGVRSDIAIKLFGDDLGGGVVEQKSSTRGQQSEPQQLRAEGGMAIAGPLTVDERSAQVRRGRMLEYFTVGYNSLEGFIAIASGLLAGSIALVGFGLDSVIEVISGLALLWRLYGDADEAKRERVEQRALRIVGVSLLILAAYVAFDAVKSLVRREAPEESIVGIVLAAVSLIVMPLLVRAKRRVARLIGSAALHADAMQTQICTYLSAILLGGLLLNAVAGWWWADPLAALVMVPIIVKEGWEAVRGEHCDDCHP